MKKRKITRGSFYLLSACALLLLTKYKDKEYEEIKQTFSEIGIFKEEEQLFQLSSCDVIIENCPDGRVKHHFVPNKIRDRDLSSNETETYTEFFHTYKAITEKDLEFSYSQVYYEIDSVRPDGIPYTVSYEEIPYVRDYIFDYHLPYYRMNIYDLKLPEDYSCTYCYTKEELKELEQKLDASVYENKIKKKEYKVDRLLLAEIDGEYAVFDIYQAVEIMETTNKYNVEDLHKVYYVPSIGNDFKHLKVSSGMSVLEELKKRISSVKYKLVIEEITVLDQTIQNDLRGKRVVVKDLSSSLEHFFDGYPPEKLTEDQILEIVDKLNQPQVRLEKRMEDKVSLLNETNSPIKLFYSYNPDGSYFSISLKEEGKKENLSDSFYEQINEIIKKGNVKEIVFRNIDETCFDLAKKVDYSAILGEIKIEFENTSSAIAKEILSALDTKRVHLDWEENQVTDELQSFLEFLTENNLPLKSFGVNLYRQKEQAKTTTKERFSLLEKVNTTSLIIEIDGFTKPLSLDLELHPNIENLSIQAYESVYLDQNSIDYLNGKLGDVKIQSKNEFLDVSFYKMDLLENTTFTLPDTSYVRLYDLDCKSIRAFSTLKNVRGLEFTEYWNTKLRRGAILYRPKEILNEEEKVYTDYEEVLKDIKYFFKLKQLSKKIEKLAHVNGNYETDFGKYATITDERETYATLEDMKNKQNALFSYFGEEELRCIRFICLANETEEVQVSTLEEYTYYINEGYEVIGYTFVNQYAGTPNACEFFVPVENMKLILTPFQ